MKRAKLPTVIIAACTLALAVSTAALAEEKKADARVPMGIYGGGGLGPAFMEGGDTNLAWRFMAWARPIKYLALELGYFNLRDNDLGEKTDGFALSGLAMYPIGAFDIYGKGGFAVASIGEETEIEPTFGGGFATQLGAGPPWMRRLGARVEYERFTFDSDANVVWFLLYYQFADL